MSSPILELNDVYVAYLQREILRGVTLSVHAGEIVALLGENGSGKSTTLKVVSGLLRPKQGKVRYRGRDLDGLGVAQRQRLGIGYLMQGGRVFPNLSVQENFDLSVAEARDAGRKPGCLGDCFPALSERRDDRAGLLSGGQRQMLAIELILAQRPDLLLLDEPTAALAEDLALSVMKAIQQYVTQSSSAVLLVEQNTDLIRPMCVRTLHIQQGRL